MFRLLSAYSGAFLVTGGLFLYGFSATRTHFIVVRMQQLFTLNLANCQPLIGILMFCAGSTNSIVSIELQKDISQLRLLSDLDSDVCHWWLRLPSICHRRTYVRWFPSRAKLTPIVSVLRCLFAAGKFCIYWPNSKRVMWLTVSLSSVRQSTVHGSRHRLGHWSARIPVARYWSTGVTFGEHCVLIFDSF